MPNQGAHSTHHSGSASRGGGGFIKVSPERSPDNMSFRAQQ